MLLLEPLRTSPAAPRVAEEGLEALHLRLGRLQAPQDAAAQAPGKSAEEPVIYNPEGMRLQQT